MTDKAPAAVVTRTETVSHASRPSTLQVVVSCPYCGGEHYHGAVDEDHVEGWRSAHCRAGDYFVTVGRVH